jgi:hypothetical protein
MGFIMRKNGIIGLYRRKKWDNNLIIPSRSYSTAPLNETMVKGRGISTLFWGPCLWGV